MFKLAADGFYRVPEWAAFEWLEHGFGTREAVHSGDNLATAKQVHSADVLIVERPGLQGTGDALISNTPGLVVSVKTADCLPILLVDPVNRAVAAVHAGWRGTAQRIVERAIVTMGRHFSSVSDNIEAAIGPGIGRCCFEVGAEVAREFGPYESDQKTCLDLARINRDQLASRRVKRVYESGLCTFCSAREFYSFRREREQAGRMISMAGQTA